MSERRPTTRPPCARWIVAALFLIAVSGCNPRVQEFEERGDRYSARGEYVDARTEYELAIREAGGDVPTRLWMKSGALALRAKNFREANRIFGEVVEEDPDRRDEVRALYQLNANRWVATGDTFAAIQAIEWVRAQDSTANLGPLFFTLGDAAYQRPDYDAAVEAYLLGLARARDQASPEVYARLGDALERMRNCPAAIEYFRRYLERREGDAELAPEARFRLGTCAYRMAEQAFASDDFDRARRYVDLVIETGEPVSELDGANLLRAKLHEREGDREAAMRTYRGVVERNRDQRSRAALEAFRRLKQLEFGMPLRTAERAAETENRNGGGR
ncbi:MAG: tetratricopeptide repeat protein [Gemmatimonadota bacterium]|nr:tetratricopeptide repeat protein [Gemmatimonadota bacterium]